jgi:16S rRNA (cytosine1402-N4)-methyltransferase
VHLPVMRDEVVSLLRPEQGGLFVDCTIGLGGHARALLEAGASSLIGFDRDPAALARARDTLADWKDRVDLVHADFRDLSAALDSRAIGRVRGILADLGVSSMQLDMEGRGFSFRRDEPLDMRMDTTRGQTAADLLATVDESELADVIFRFGEERHSRRIARSILTARSRAPIETTGQLADIVRRSIPHRGWQRIDPATRTFQALRIWVNRELDGLDAFVTTAAARLEQGGRMAVIAFHSLEDRIVKHTFRTLARDEAFRIVTKRPLTAGDTEREANPRARSAKLRALERVA